MKVCSLLSAAFAVPYVLGAPSKQAAWPDTPFTVSGRDIISASGAKVVYAGVNWPGAADTMLPEGLQYNSIANISGLIKSLGMNVVRLTYAIEMVDDCYANSPKQSLQNTLTHALGSTNGAKVLQQILNNNPQLTASTTRLRVAAELAKQQIWVHLDNHVSKAQWCCGAGDGNAWFRDTYFNVANWQRGLGLMANHAKSWAGLASMALRNELRQPSNSNTLPYTWNTWIENVIPAANTIYKNKTSPLIFFSGENYDTDDTYFIQRQTYNSETFTPSSYAFSKKIVYEIHNYQNGATACHQIQPGLYNNAYCAMNLSDNSCPNHGPVVMTEFGFDQTDGSMDGVYAQCIKSTVLKQPGYPGGWMQWVLSGSYYIREGTQDYEETWGLLNHNWSEFRNLTVVNKYVKPFVQATHA
ncbi:hypothetical protein AC579_9867 [Pseudocercospora musae]|uniref:Glycoside hydrolase family 5 domain-containing protein n=1 Tax=Pseudocercospora musae TaxID=113226 RepID=A0A139I825_9PEZI|nr:hypothetical protein AC579_9867 [Pseudocercospora musae]KXT10898.1 hypothetical protein AC579_9867 [Pseudocercospora musae]